MEKCHVERLLVHSGAPDPQIRPEVARTRWGYYITNVHCINIDAMGAMGILEEFFEHF